MNKLRVYNYIISSIIIIVCTNMKGMSSDVEGTRERPLTERLLSLLSTGQFGKSILSRTCGTFLRLIVLVSRVVRPDADSIVHHALNPTVSDTLSWKISVQIFYVNSIVRPHILLMHNYFPASQSYIESGWRCIGAWRTFDKVDQLLF